MRRLLFIVIAAMGMFKGYSQALVQTYTDRCTGEVKVFSVPMNGATTIAFYNKSRTFTAAQFQNGELRAWLEETYNWYRALSPCSTNNATTQTTQQTTSQATTNATNAATNATSGATQNTGTTNTTTNGTTGTTGSTSTGGGTTSGEGTTGSSSSSSSSGSSSTGGNTSNGNSGSDSSNNSSGSDNSSGNGTGGDDSSSGGSSSSEGSSSEEGSSGESSNESKTEESKEETKEEVKEEKQEEKKEEEKKEEEKKEEEKEESNEESKEEEEEEEKENQLAPPIVTANIVTMQMIDGVLTNAASFGYSQSSLTGEDTYTANAMVWSNLKQFSINVSKSSVLFNWDKREDIMVLDPFTNKFYKFGEVAARGSIMKVQTISLGYMKMFTTNIVTFGVSDVFLGQKDNFWKGFVGGYAVTGMAVFLAGNQYLGTAALTAFGTKPFAFKRVTISPMIAYSMTPFTVDNITKKINFNEHGNYVLGSNFDFNITQRFKANIGGTVIGSTMPGMPISWALTIGSRFQF